MVDLDKKIPGVSGLVTTVLNKKVKEVDNKIPDLRGFVVLKWRENILLIPIIVYL